MNVILEAYFITQVIYKVGFLKKFLG